MLCGLRSIGLCFCFLYLFSGLSAADPVSPEQPPAAPRLMTGLDVLEADHFASLAGMRIGLITNHTGRDSSGQNTVDLFRRAPGLKLTAIFTPEHGLYGRVDEKIPSGFDLSLGIPIYSLYGQVLRPTRKMLEGIDALVFDIQDAGARFYTYISTMAYAMEAAAEKGIPFYVLDRPDPITASAVQGPVMDKELKSFTGYFPLPVRYGMTIGELASMFSSENRIGGELHILKMRGYGRSEWYDQTGLAWVSPSPNLRTMTEAALYPGIAIVEGANVSVGRGTGTPFEVIGAPWIDAKRFARYLNNRRIPGVSFRPAEFTPKSDRYEKKDCKGVRIILADRGILDGPALGVEIASALYKLYPTRFQLRDILSMIGSHNVLRSINEGIDPRKIARDWQPSLEEFKKRRSKYLLY